MGQIVIVDNTNVMGRDVVLPAYRGRDGDHLRSADRDLYDGGLPTSRWRLGVSTVSPHGSERCVPCLEPVGDRVPTLPSPRPRGPTIPEPALVGVPLRACFLAAWRDALTLPASG